MTRLLLLLLVLATACHAEDRAAFSFDQHPGAPTPVDAPLTSVDGGTTSLAAIANGRPILLIPGYFRCPNLCGIVRDDVFSALARTTLDPATYATAVITIDPAETPPDAQAAQQAAADRYPAAAHAHFLTGDTSALQQSIGFRSRPGLDAQFLHPAGLVVLTPGGAVSSYILGVGYAPAAIELALAQAGQNIIARPASPILLLCFHFDPATGRYTPEITKILRLAAALTAITLIAALAITHRRGPRRPSP